MTILEQMEELQSSQKGIKQELLDIKEQLADKEDQINNVEKGFNKSVLDTKSSLRKMKDELVGMINVASEDPDLSDYVLKDFLLANYYNQSDVNKLIASNTDILVKKSELYKLIPIDEYAPMKWVEEKFLKKSDISLSDYVTSKEMNRSLNDLSSTIYNYVPEVFNSLVSDSGLASVKYVESNYVSKEDIHKYLDGEIGSTDLSVLGEYAKLRDLDNYVRKTTLKEYVTTEKFEKDITKINDTLKSLNSSSGSFVTKSQIGEFVNQSEMVNYVSGLGYVTKSYLDSELEKLQKENSSSSNDDMSYYLTIEDYDNLKKYTDSVVKKLPTYADVYTRQYVDSTFAKKENIEDDYYTKMESNQRYATKNEVAGTYVTIVDAYSDFLSKEDYRGIKDAMTLNSAYKNAQEIFELLLTNGKILDGFYIINDQIVVVKDGKKYSTNLTGSSSYTKNEIDDMDLVTKDWLQTEYKVKNWVWDTGGNY